MSYQFDNEQDESEDFKDQPDEVDGNSAPAAQVTIQKPDPRKTAAEMAEEAADNADDHDVEEELEEAEESQILTDARLRLEQGRLYELVMKHDLFDGIEADPRAIKTVQKEIKAYAQERMEIMLGMRQEAPKEAVNAFPMELFPFNSLEVDTLKALAAAATKGASRDAEPLNLGPQPPPARTTLNPIGKNASKTTPAPKKPLKKQVMPVQRRREVEQILAEEGLTEEEINQVFDPNRKYLDRKELSKMTEDEIIQRNRKIRNRRVENPAAVPMPSPEQMAQAYEQRSLAAEATKPGWRELIGMVKAMPPTKVNNEGQ